MYIKNLSNRNVSCCAAYNVGRKIPARITVPAGATLEVDDAMAEKCKTAINALIEADVLKITKKPVAPKKKEAPKEEAE